MLDAITVLDPLKKTAAPTSEIIGLVCLLPAIAPVSTHDKLRDKFEEYQLLDLPEDTYSQSIDQYWFRVSSVKNLRGKLRFPFLGRLAKAALSLPHSSAECERVFSQVNLIKTEHHNKISTEMLNALLQVRYGICSATNFTPSEAMYDLFTQDMYDHKQ